MSAIDYQRRVRDALSALVSLCWMERALRCENQSKPTRQEMFPDDYERNEMLEKIVMADGLASGAPSKSPGALTAVAKAIACLSLAPGGVKFLGRHWHTVDLPNGTCRLQEVDMEAEQAKQSTENLRRWFEREEQP